MAGYRWDTPDIYAACDMIVIASLRTEASPIVLREAFASGRPVIATKVGDIPEIVRHRENGVGDPGIHFRSGTGGVLRSEWPPLRDRKFFVRQNDGREAARRFCCIAEETRARICFPLFAGHYIVGEQLIASINYFFCGRFHVTEISG